MKGKSYHYYNLYMHCLIHHHILDLVYWGVHLGCWNKELHAAYGNLSPEAVISLGGTVRTGDLQSVVYDMEVSQEYMQN